MDGSLTVGDLLAFLEHHDIPEDTEIWVTLADDESPWDEEMSRPAGNLLWEVSSNGSGTVRILPPPPSES